VHHVAFVLRTEKPDQAELAIELYLDGKRLAAGKGPAIAAHVGDINLGRCGNTRFHDRAQEQPANISPVASAGSASSIVHCLRRDQRAGKIAVNKKPAGPLERVPPAIRCYLNLLEQID